MKYKLILLFLITHISACAVTKSKTNNVTDLEVIDTKYDEIKIVKTSKVINTDTIVFNELRFYKIRSALDTMKSMYLDHNIWTNSEIGLHQNNINRKIWTNVKLLEDEEVKFTIIADGTETKKAYYACLSIFDSNNEDCFEKNHPLKNKLIDYFKKRLQANYSSNTYYIVAQ